MDCCFERESHGPSFSPREELPTLLRPQFQTSQTKAKQVAGEPKTPMTKTGVGAQNAQFSAFHFEEGLQERLQQMFAWQDPPEVANEDETKNRDAQEPEPQALDVAEISLAETLAVALAEGQHINLDAGALAEISRAETLAVALVEGHDIGLDSGDLAAISRAETLAVALAEGHDIDLDTGDLAESSRGETLAVVLAQGQDIDLDIGAGVGYIPETSLTQRAKKLAVAKKEAFEVGFTRLMKRMQSLKQHRSSRQRMNSASGTTNVNGQLVLMNSA